MRSACKKLCLRCGLLAQVLLHCLGRQLAAGLRTALGDRLLRTPASLGQSTPGPGRCPCCCPEPLSPRPDFPYMGNQPCPAWSRVKWGGPTWVQGERARFMGQWRGEGGGTIGSWPRDSLTVCGITATGSGGPAVALLFVVFPSAPGSRRPQLSIAPHGPRLTRRAELEGKEGLGQ